MHSMGSEFRTSLPYLVKTDSSDWSSTTEITSNQNVTLNLKRAPTPKKKEVTRTASDSKPKRSKKNIIAACLTNCRYDVIRRTAGKFSFKEVSEGENWNLYWTDLSITVERCKEMKRFQKINHFPGMLEICRKDLLARNLNRMLRMFPREYNFFPKTWCFPADLGEAIAYSKLRKNKFFILKPDAGSQGRGIIITKNLRDIRPCDRGICQVYMNKPYLIDGYKFDLRVYTLITSCEPLRIYTYKEGLVRFATSRYKEPNSVNMTNVFMHLTNYAVNKHSRTYNQDTEWGSKRKLTWFNNYMESLGHDTEGLWFRIDDVIIKTIISAHPVLKHSYVACFPNHDVIPACCELLGIDIILDRRLNPIILEVNHSPSFHTDTPLDCEVKESLLSDMFSMLNLQFCDKRKIMREDRRRIRERLLNNNPPKEPSKEHDVKNFNKYYEQEYQNRGDFRLIFPTVRTEHLYKKYFDQGQGSLYCDTAASRAREAAQNALRDEMVLKAKAEAAKRLKAATPPQEVVPARAAKPVIIPIVSCLNISCSFEPQMIVEAEEKDRLQRLAQREFLIRSTGVLEYIYFSMKRNGTLRSQDERKFAFFNKIRNVKESVITNKNGPAISDLLDEVRGVKESMGAGRCVT